MIRFSLLLKFLSYIESNIVISQNAGIYTINAILISKHIILAPRLFNSKLTIFKPFHIETNKMHMMKGFIPDTLCLLKRKIDIVSKVTDKISKIKIYKSMKILQYFYISNMQKIYTFYGFFYINRYRMSNYIIN
ncbi:hypothetical protein CSCA_0410 [Clostridium scatologenes]|uniref:Uncharacterized protein n=1 Tax=Clostridium scatologenes TaxID=1548 RepID=A0A0E3JM03_CLOSL|nr:hypothetical protein CSCA_0410 [Clostridium scatologenes]